MFRWFRNWRRKRLLNRGIPASYGEILQESYPLYPHLPKELQSKLLVEITFFIAEKSFEGFQGLEVTEEMKVLIAAQACLLLLGNDTVHFDSLKSILIYPAAYQTKQTAEVSQGVMSETESTVLGQSWAHGTVSLSWASTQAGAQNRYDGRNVVIHEFAHQLDQATGHANGLPRLRAPSRYVAWKEIMSAEYERLQDRVDRRRKTIMDAYGATHPAEFFAVASECFFEKPAQLQKHRPSLYQQLKQFYGQDPVLYDAGESS